MKIGIIGAGFAGLSAAHNLSKLGHDITIIEKDSKPGGLAIGYKENEWEWTLEEHYHHWFTNDKFILKLAQEIGHEVIIKRPKTSIFLNNKIYQLDSLFSLLKFKKLSNLQKLRMGFILALLKLNPIWKPLEKLKADEYLPKLMGNKAYKLIWQPQLFNKMGIYAKEVSLVWFWTRIYKRTTKLAYPKGGFLEFANKLSSVIEKQGGKIIFNSQVINVRDNEKVTVTIKNSKGMTKEYIFDKLIVTLPSFLFLQIATQLPQDYKNKLTKFKGLGATNMLIRFNKQFLKDGTYWLSICDYPSEVTVLVEHTNFMDKKNYHNEHLLYVGNYPQVTSNKYLLNEKQLLSLYDKILKKINPEYSKFIIDYKVFKVPFAQPIIPTNYSRLIPPFTTPLPNVYLANIEQVYPWDRGTNYAVEIGEKVAKKILSQ